MKKAVIILFIMSAVLCSCSRDLTKNGSGSWTGSESTSQRFPDKNELISLLVSETRIPKNDINISYISVLYADIDQDPDLELFISYREGIHKGYFLIYKNKGSKYKKVFSQPWAVERMNGREVTVASGNEKIHQLTANIIHMEQEKVYVLWSAIEDKYDYSNPLNGIETHGYYYVDTNAVLHYCYKIERTDENAKVLNKEYKEELYVWNPDIGKYEKQQQNK